MNLRVQLLVFLLVTALAGAEPAWHQWLVRGSDLHCSQQGRQEFLAKVGLINGKMRYRGHYSVAGTDFKTFVAVEASSSDAGLELDAARQVWLTMFGKKVVEVSNESRMGDQSYAFTGPRADWMLLWRKDRRWGMLAIRGLKLTRTERERLGRLAVRRGVKAIR